MSTILNTDGRELQVPVPVERDDFKVAVFTAAWNAKVTGSLLAGVLDTLHQAGVKDENIFSRKVPGTVELVNAAAMALRTMPDLKAVIILGCVIRGDTPHFDYVCQIAAEGTARLNAEGGAPVVFGVLTVENEQQALDRAGGVLGNKGSEAAAAAIEMANLHAASASMRFAAFRR